MNRVERTFLPRSSQLLLLGLQSTLLKGLGVGADSRSRLEGAHQAGSARPAPPPPVYASTPAQTTRQGPNIWPGAEAPIYQLIFTFGLPMGCIHTSGNLTDSLTPMLLMVRGGGFPLIRYTNNDYWRCVPRLQSLQAVPEDQRPRQGPGRGAGLTVWALL